MHWRYLIWSVELCIFHPEQRVKDVFEKGWIHKYTRWLLQSAMGGRENHLKQSSHVHIHGENEEFELGGKWSSLFPEMIWIEPLLVWKEFKYKHYQENVCKNTNESQSYLENREQGADLCWHKCCKRLAVHNHKENNGNGTRKISICNRNKCGVTK